MFVCFCCCSVLLVLPSSLAILKTYIIRALRLGSTCARCSVAEGSVSLTAQYTLFVFHVVCLSKLIRHFKMQFSRALRLGQSSFACIVFRGSPRQLPPWGPHVKRQRRGAKLRTKNTDIANTVWSLATANANTWKLLAMLLFAHFKNPQIKRIKF